MSSFRDLQKIYEDYRGMSFNPSPNKAYTADPSKYSYRGTLPFNAGGSDNAYASNENNFTGGHPTPISCDEEQYDDGDVSKKEVIEKIKELQEIASKDEMMYAVHLLGTLKEFLRSKT